MHPILPKAGNQHLSKGLTLPIMVMMPLVGDIHGDHYANGYDDCMMFMARLMSGLVR